MQSELKSKVTTARHSPDTGSEASDCQPSTEVVEAWVQKAHPPVRPSASESEDSLSLSHALAGMLQ